MVALSKWMTRLLSKCISLQLQTVGLVRVESQVWQNGVQTGQQSMLADRSLKVFRGRRQSVDARNFFSSHQHFHGTTTFAEPASDDSSESISGRFRNQLSLGVGPNSRPRYLNSRDRAIALKAPWRPAEWSETQWQDQLRKAGELAPGYGYDRQAQVVAERPLAPAERPPASREVPMLGVLEVDPGGQTAADPTAGVLPARALAARDAQTERVGTRLREENVTPSGMVTDLMNGLEKERILERVREHQLRSADIFEAKTLLDGLMTDLRQREERLTGAAVRGRSPRGKGGTGGGWIPNVAVQMNGPLYAMGPQPPLPASGVTRSPDIFSNSQPKLENKVWL